MKVAFHIYHFTFRGSEVATFDYAFFNKLLLNNESLIVVPRSQTQPCNNEVLEKFKSQFDILYYDDINSLQRICKENKVEVLYTLKYGTFSDLILKSIPTVVHCVFTTIDKHGDIYAGVSESVSRHNKGLCYPYVNHIVSLPDIKGNFREQLDIPYDAIVFGRHGGEDTFDIPFVKNVIIDILSRRKDIYFIFAVRPYILKDVSSKNIIYLDSFTDTRIKTKFINTCDAMLHACSLGESFGLSILEFCYRNKPVICWTGGSFHKQHHSHLREKGVYYNDERELLNIIENFDKTKYSRIDYTTISKPFSPRNVMKKFNDVFLKPFVKGSPLKVKRIKMSCNWCSSETLCKEWSNMCERDYRWRDLEITHSDIDIDYYVIINYPPPNEKYIPKKTIVFQMEPWVYDEKLNWGVKTWGEWSNPDPNKFLAVRGRKSGCHNNAFWQLETTLAELSKSNIPKTKTLSSICSSKYFDDGHIKRIDFLKYLESRGGIDIDIYNYNNTLGFKNWKGPVTPYVDKGKGIMPYKYYFMMENNFERDFITEKIWEPILCESLVFYYGCPNVGDYINPEAIVILDPDNFEKSYNLIKRAIYEDWWSKKIDLIRAEKAKILNELCFFPVIDKIIKEDLKRVE